MIVIGDLHGNFDTLMALLDIIPQSEKDKGIVLCGDLIDRGPKSMEIVQWCIDNKIQSVMGNHETMMLEWNKNGRSYKNQFWLGQGGLETLDSYKERVDHPYLKGEVQWDLFEEHCKYLSTLPLYLAFPKIINEQGRKLVVSHSNIQHAWEHIDNKELMESSRIREQVLWSRPSQIKDIPSIYNIIGHTPQKNGARIRKPYACIDTGCFYINTGYGILTALQYPEMIIYEHENIDSKVGHIPKKATLTVEDLINRKRMSK